MIDDLVQRLATGDHPVEAARPEKTVLALKECLDRGYLHIMFKNTETELGIQIDQPNSRLDADFANRKGTIHVEGGVTLNYVRTRLVADIDLSTLEGTGRLVPVSEDEYKRMMAGSADSVR